MLRIENIDFSYNDENPLYKNIAYDFGMYGLTAIFGISGSGKTTLLHILGGMLKPQNGTVIFQGLSVHDLTMEQLAKYRNMHVGFSFQDHMLLEECDVNQNLHLPFLLGSGQVDSARRKYLIDFFGIQGLLHKSIQHISGGERERVSLIKSMIHKPDVLILDEPGDSLDAENRKKLYELLREYATNHLVILTSHNPEILQIYGLSEQHTAQKIQFFSSR